jgi:hypothetical protein
MVTTMRIGFVSIDDVNRNLAQQMLPPEMQLECSETGDSSAQIDAWVYDLDQLPPGQRNSVLLKLSSAARKQPVIVLSYGLPKHLSALLYRNGIRIDRRLEPRVFEELKAEMLRRNGCGAA